MTPEPMALTEWKVARLTALQAEDGWLNLCDRVEIPSVAQSVGAAAENDVVLSTGPDFLGVVDVAAQTFTLPNGAKLGFAKSAGGFAQVRVTPFLLELHDVDGQIALRLRDLRLPRIADLHYFPYNPEWVIRAKWKALPKPLAKAIEQKGGSATQVHLTHIAEFRHAGQPITLLATHWKGDEPMFVIRDKTSGAETYAASRFLIGEEISQSEITLDFNRSFHPPCSFTDFAICPLPPRENILPFRINAGERY